MSKEEIITRLRRVEGQIRGVQSMLQQDRDCEEIITQLMAARAALDKIALAMMDEYIEECLHSPEKGLDKEKLLRTLRLFLKIS